MVVKLLAHGADPTFRDGEGCDCLHLASQLGHTALVAYLVAKGCPVNAPDGNGMTALMWACLKVTHSVDPTRLLLTLGASVRYYDICFSMLLPSALHSASITTLLYFYKKLVSELSLEFLLIF